MDDGVQSVTVHGLTMMQQLFVGNWDMPVQVN